MKDLNRGNYYPYLQNRSVTDLDQVGYYLHWKDSQIWKYSRIVALTMFDHLHYTGIKRSDITGEPHTAAPVKKNKTSMLIGKKNPEAKLLAILKK